MKSGTTSLYHDLVGHPQTFLPYDKEPNILNVHQEDRAIEQAYASLFSAADSTAVCGEASTMYTMFPLFHGAPRRASELTGGNLRLIYILRDPIERIVSQHRHWYATGRVSRDINVAVRTESLLIEFSRYAKQLQLWSEYFSNEQILLIRMESYMAKRQEMANRVFRFLGLVPHDVEQVVANQAGSVRKLPSWLERLRTRAWIQNSFRGPVGSLIRRQLRQRLGRRRKEATVGPTAETVRFLYEQLVEDSRQIAQRMMQPVLSYSIDEAVRRHASH